MILAVRPSSDDGSVNVPPASRAILRPAARSFHQHLVLLLITGADVQRDLHDPFLHSAPPALARNRYRTASPSSDMCLSCVTSSTPVTWRLRNLIGIWSSPRALIDRRAALSGRL